MLSKNPAAPPSQKWNAVAGARRPTAAAPPKAVDAKHAAAPVTKRLVAPSKAPASKPAALPELSPAEHKVFLQLEGKPVNELSRIAARAIVRAEGVPPAVSPADAALAVDSGLRSAAGNPLPTVAQWVHAGYTAETYQTWLTEALQAVAGPAQEAANAAPLAVPPGVAPVNVHAPSSTPEIRVTEETIPVEAVTAAETPKAKEK